jgi:hypothetical protein
VSPLSSPLFARSRIFAAPLAVALASLVPSVASAQVAEMVVRTPRTDDEVEEASKDAKRRDEARGAVMIQVAGIRALATDVKAGPLSGDATSVVFAIDQETITRTKLATGGGLTGRTVTHAHIGGGSGGFDGQYSGLITGGPRFGGDTHGIALRGGLGGHIRGNNRFYQSELAFPVGDVAYQVHLARELFVELGATGGYVLVGRDNVDGGRRRLGNSGKVGGFAYLTARHFQLVGSVGRLFASSGPPTPIDTAQASACLSPFMGLLFCGQLAETRGALTLAGAAEQSTRVRVIGLSVGLGGLSVD